MNLRPYQQQAITGIRQAFADNIKRVCYVAPCGAGKSLILAYIAQHAAQKHNNVLFIIHREELLNQIKQDVGEHEHITMLMAQTAVRRLDKIPTPMIIISDEFHHGVANTWRKIFDHFKDAYIIGLTATPARLDGSGLGDICDKLIIGPTAEQLIEWGYLAPFKYYAPPIPIDLETVKIKMGDYDKETLEIAVNKPKITGKAIQHYKELADGKQAIIYCTTIQHSKDTVQEFCNAGYNAAHVDGKTPKVERAAMIEDFKSGKLQIMSNVDLFGEGLNLPGVEVVILLRPTQSLTLYIQQSMRSMRPGKDKTAIIIDAVSNVYRHGLPSIKREWTLDAQKRRKASEQSTVGIRTCPACFMVLKPQDKCPYCGYEFKMTARELAAEDGTLQEYDAEQAERAKLKKKIELWSCKTMDDLRQVAADRGYKPGWVWQQAKIRHIKE